MTEEKKSYSKMAVTGFCFALLTLIAVALAVFVGPGIYHLNSKNDAVVTGVIYFVLIAAILALLLPLLGSLFSIIGLIISIVKKKKGKALAIIGIVLSELELIALIIVFMGIFSIGLIGY